MEGVYVGFWNFRDETADWAKGMITVIDLVHTNAIVRDDVLVIQLGIDGVAIKKRVLIRVERIRTNSRDSSKSVGRKSSHQRMPLNG